MHDMFFNYDHKIKTVCDECIYECDRAHPPIFCHLYKDKKELSHESGPKLIYNINNEILGVMARENSTFRLFFTVAPDDQAKFIDALNLTVFKLTIFNRIHKPVVEVPAKLYLDDGLITVELASNSDGPLTAGIYRMRLDMINGDNRYALFAENDGVLSIL